MPQLKEMESIFCVLCGLGEFGNKVITKIEENGVDSRLLCVRIGSSDEISKMEECRCPVFFVADLDEKNVSQLVRKLTESAIENKEHSWYWQVGLLAIPDDEENTHIEKSVAGCVSTIKILKTGRDESWLIDRLCECVQGLLKPILDPQMIGLDILDSKHIFERMDSPVFGVGEANGENANLEALKEAIGDICDTHRLSIEKVRSSSKVFVFAEGDLSLLEVNQVAEACQFTEETEIVFSGVYEDSEPGKAKVYLYLDGK